MANKIGLVSAGLAVASGAMMTYIITTETFAVATLGGDESCELGTLGVFTSSYTPDCDPSKPGDAFEGEPTLEFWPLFSAQNSFGGAFESLGVGAIDKLPEGWPAEEYDCAAGVNSYLDDFAAGTGAIWATVDSTLQVVFQTLLASTAPANLTPAVVGVAAGVIGSSLTTPIVIDTSDPLAEIPAGTLADISTLIGTKNCLGAPLEADKAACFYFGEYAAVAGGGGCADESSILGCLSAIATGVIVQPFATMFSGNGPLGGTVLVSAQLTAVGLAVEAAQFTAAMGLYNACMKFDNADYAACETAAIPLSPPGTIGTSLAGLNPDLTEPHILGCLFTGLDENDPLQGTPPDLGASLPGSGCLGFNTGISDVTPGVKESYATAYEVFQRISVDEILPIAPAGTEDSIASIGTFAAIISGCADVYDVLTSSPAAACAQIVGDHRDGLDATTTPPDVAHAALKGGLCVDTGPLSVIASLKLRTTCQGSTSFWSVPEQVINGVYSLDAANTYSFEQVAADGTDLSNPVLASAKNKEIIAAPAIEKCKDDNEDAQAIEQAQSLTPVGVALTFVGAVAGLVVAAMGGKAPKVAPLIPAVVVLTGAVIFMVALLGVRNAPVYELVGQPCPVGSTCYTAGTGNKMALPAILIALLSGVGLIVSVFLGGSGEDYSSFKETQVGMKA